MQVAINLAVTALVAWVVFQIAEHYTQIIVAWGSVFMIGVVASYFVYKYVGAERRLLTRARRIAQFASRHHYDTDELEFPKKTKTFSLVLGERQFFENQMQGKGWRYSDLSYVNVVRTKYGDYDSEKVYYSILEIELDRPLPHMLFDAPGAHGLAYLAEISESQRVSLEGDFDQYFVTYFPRHYDIDARSIISPEVMAAMIDSGVSDIEIAGKKLYLYSPLLDIKYLQDFIDDGLLIRDKMMDHAVHYRDDRVSEEKRADGDISRFGTQLMYKPKFPWWTVLWSAVGLIYLLSGIARSTAEDISFNTVLAIAVYMGVLIAVSWADIYQSWIRVNKRNTRLERSYRKKHGR